MMIVSFSDEILMFFDNSIGTNYDVTRHQLGNYAKNNLNNFLEPNEIIFLS